MPDETNDKPIPRFIDRKIFGWDCRGKLKRSDPMQVQRRMAECAAAMGFSQAGAVADLRLLQGSLLNATEADKQADNLAGLRAQGNLAAMTRAGFKLTDIEVDEENGWTEDELLSLLDRFWLWCEKKNQPTDGSSTSPSIAE